ncbi:MAG: glycerol-3-phosphate acyltransferase [candidate division WOR-3 bacterium]|nr:glycerol-3-phosphate acyltransferase [candidate division WOR-3 bacterium]
MQKILFIIIGSVCGFILGSCMFSYWLGRLIGKDIRKYGDGNPGAINAFKAGGYKIGIPAMILDFLKGFLPIFIIYHYNAIQDFTIIFIAVALLLGHIFPVFLDFKGGKSIAPSFGIWAGFTLWKVPVSAGIIMAFLKLGLKVKNDALITLIGFAGSFIMFIFFSNALPLIIVAILNLIALIYTHRNDLLRSVK